ncbi:MAG: hypothetical protein ACE5G5_09975, partial [Candidatus Methylomirabilales bacterium]
AVRPSSPSRSSGSKTVEPSSVIGDRFVLPEAAVQRSETLSIAIQVPFDRVWTFLTDPTKLHLWTVDFALAPPEPRGDVFRVQTPRGELDLFVKADQETGVIDYYFGRDGQYRCSPSRLVRTGDGVVYIFTQFEPPGVPTGRFETLVANVRKELEILKSLFEGK